MANYLRKLRARGQIAQLSVGALSPQGSRQLLTESEIAELISSTPRYLELRARAQIVSLSDMTNPDIFRAEIPRADRKFIGGALDPQAGAKLIYGSCESEAVLLSSRRPGRRRSPTYLR